MSYLISDVITRLQHWITEREQALSPMAWQETPEWQRERCTPLPSPRYNNSRTNGENFFLAVEDMSRHMTNEGWQLAEALQFAGYTLVGKNLPYPEQRVSKILSDNSDITSLILQDKREWDVQKGMGWEENAGFEGVHLLNDRSDIFKLTVLKDAQARPFYHRDSANELGCHAWVCYYHPDIVAFNAPYVRKEHIVRTYHTVDKEKVPPYEYRRGGCLLSGAISACAYPFRARIKKAMDSRQTKGCIGWLPHKGYNNRGTLTNEYLQTLSQFRVSICTASRYGYALRKIIESTACGCRVITDLPEDEVLPGIDDNLVRVHPDIPIPDLLEIIQREVQGYNPDRQEQLANLCLEHYDYRVQGVELWRNIHNLRRNYNANN